MMPITVSNPALFPVLFPGGGGNISIWCILLIVIGISVLIFAAVWALEKLLGW